MRNPKENIKLIRLTEKNITEHTIEKMMMWRFKHERWFPSIFEITYEGTRRWADQIINDKNTVLYLVYYKRILSGHMGLSNIDREGKICDLYSVLRGEEMERGSMTDALYKLINIAFFELHMQQIYLTTMSDNIKALNLYRRCGFTTYKEKPIFFINKKWVENDYDYKIANKFNIYMRLENDYNERCGAY